MDDLTAFIKARLDEDEKAAKWASAGPWTLRGGGYVVGGPDDRDGSPAVTVAAQTQQWNGQHIARHDPARVLREVTAKRAIVAAHQPYSDPYAPPGGPYCGTCGDAEQYTGHDYPCATVRHLAAVWSDHPDYQKDWSA